MSHVFFVKSLEDFGFGFRFDGSLVAFRSNLPFGTSLLLSKLLFASPLKIVESSLLFDISLVVLECVLESLDASLLELESALLFEMSSDHLTSGFRPEGFLT